MSFKILFSVVLALDVVRSDWVEIPFLQPSSTTTPKPSVIRKNTNHFPSQPVFIANSNFINHALSTTESSVEEDSTESEEDVPASDGGAKNIHVNHFYSPASPVRISDLVDYEQFNTGSTTERAMAMMAEQMPTPGKYSHFQKRIYEYPRVNVSSKLGWSPGREEHKFVTANRNPFSTHIPDREPLSNKYEEESIEYLNTEASIQPMPTAKSISDRVAFSFPEPSDEEVDTEETSSDQESYEEKDHKTAPASSEAPPLPNDRFHDFDDYDAQDDQQPPDWGLKNVSILKRRRRPIPGRVTIIRVIPPRRHRIRPAPGVEAEESGFSGFLKFLKRMQDGFVLNTAKNIGDKVKLLQNLKDQLLLSIEKRLSTLWGRPAELGTDAEGDLSVITEYGEKMGQRRERRRRVKRGGGWMEHPSSGHGGMDFPSAEAALLTISFLTFAVFLIKLVLQVINTIKSKHYTYSTMSAVNGVNPATLKIVNRNKRSEANDEFWKHNLDILSAINSYKYT